MGDSILELKDLSHSYDGSEISLKNEPNRSIRIAVMDHFIFFSFVPLGVRSIAQQTYGR